MKKSIFLLFAIVSLVGMVAISGCDRPETYTVTFNPNGGTGTMQPQTFTEGEAQALSRNAFTYDGYTFSGWNTVQGGSGASYPDGYTLTATADMTLYAQWTSNGTNPTPGSQSTTGTLNGHYWVDLGFPSGTLWATCNVGANTPEEYGDYFAWGEITPKETYDLSTYSYCNGSNNTLTKYCNNAEYGNEGFMDTLTTLEAIDDAATVNWGEGWRMPTSEEFDELKNNCTVTWTTQNGVIGRLFISNINGKTIFLPAAGCHIDESLYREVSGHYWSSSLGTDRPDLAWYLYFYSGDYNMSSHPRDCGLTVRAVCAQ